jgi:hypothetical protein
MKFTRLAIVASVMTATFTPTVAFAATPESQPKSYDTICVIQTLPGGKPLPEICVYNPL